MNTLMIIRSNIDVAMYEIIRGTYQWVLWDNPLRDWSPTGLCIDTTDPNYGGIRAHQPNPLENTSICCHSPTLAILLILQQWDIFKIVIWSIIMFWGMRHIFATFSTQVFENLPILVIPENGTGEPAIAYAPAEFILRPGFHISHFPFPNWNRLKCKASPA